MFATRSTKLERIDTGDYTDGEYKTFLREIAFINKYLGDRSALKKTLLRDIAKQDPPSFSVLDVGAGSGELLRTIAFFARDRGLAAKLVGIDLNPISASVTSTASKTVPEIVSVRGDAFRLPFADNSFDHVISSLFFHHLTDDQIPDVLREMNRVSRSGVYVIDLHRHRAAYVLYRIFCFTFRISPLVTQDGSLSIKKGFRPHELLAFADALPEMKWSVVRSFPFRLVLRNSRSAQS